jgi:hypothetical protein
MDKPIVEKHIQCLEVIGRILSIIINKNQAKKNNKHTIVTLNQIIIMLE